MQTRVIVTWRNIDNIFSSESKANRFFEKEWDRVYKTIVYGFHDKSDYANNFQRYCIIQHRDSLQVEYFETIEMIGGGGVFCADL